MTHVVVRVARNAGIVALFILAAMLGILSGVMFAYAGDLPQVSALDNYAPSTITRIYAANGQVVGEFATQRRVVVGYDDINPVLRQAIIATEDASFDSHFGINIWRIFVAAAIDIIERRREQGASTLTQQVARNLDQFGLTKQKFFDRKIREIILAIQIEKRYTKKEIFAIYCNQMYLGHGAYGIEAASRLYFNKTNKQLNLEEAALIAGIFQTPERQSPFVDMKRAVNRRNVVLQRMADEHYITQAQADAAKAKPIVTRGQPNQPPGIAPFFVEEVRKHLERQYGAKTLYENGLSVTTTLDPKLQELANKAIEHGLRRYDKRHGWRQPRRNVLAEKHTLEGFRDDRWNRPIAVGDVVPAVVITAPKTGPARLHIGRYHADLSKDGYAWTGSRKTAADLFKPGDLLEVAVTKLDEATGAASVTLEQTPLAEGALVAIENRTGQIKAMVGGWNFNRSKFNRAVQAYRQLGSTFKPIVYTTAIDRGFTPTSILIDAPVSYPAGNGQTYSPHNYDHQFQGPITLRWALEESRNIPAIKLMDTLGPKNVLEEAKRFGFEEDFPPYLPIALGAGDATLLEVTSAYTVFPNQGVRMKPFDVLAVKDRDGNLLEENRGDPSDVIRADTAFVMTNILRGVLIRGTAQSAAGLAAQWPLAGKTGTVDDNTDAWFIGFDPDITVGVWMGFDEKKSLGGDEQGAKAALPMWREFMEGYIAGRPDKDHPPQFTAPGNIVFLSVDKSNGAVMPPETPGSINEAFISGTQPGANSFSRQP
ncbi:MAG TPA: PBP1A family penicillin-binding protein [Vicinamibacterales bacterium]|nr:PBP1A family penicillin-binding protein [Vicinamibacterales bacterium]